MRAEVPFTQEKQKNDFPKQQITVLVGPVTAAVVRQGLRALLNVDGHFKMVGEAKTGREVVDK